MTRPAIEERILRFQELNKKGGKFYKLMNFNLYILQMCFRTGRFIKPTQEELNNYIENRNFYS